MTDWQRSANPWRQGHLLDNDAITATLNGGQMNGIKAIIAFGEMILLTAGGEYKVTVTGTTNIE